MELAALLGQTPDEQPLSINRLIEQTKGRGIFLVLILLASPFIIPVSLPGISTLFGLAVMVIGLRLAFGHQPKLPKLLGERPLPPRLRRFIGGGGMKFLRWVERLVKPRKSLWMSWPSIQMVHALLIVLLGFLLALPFPPLPPLTNSLPGYSLILLSAAIMEEDGIAVWVAYAVATGTLVYLLLMAAVLHHAALKIWQHFI